MDYLCTLGMRCEERSESKVNLSTKQSFEGVEQIIPRVSKALRHCIACHGPRGPEPGGGGETKRMSVPPSLRAGAAACIKSLLL